MLNMQLRKFQEHLDNSGKLVTKNLSFEIGKKLSI